MEIDGLTTNGVLIMHPKGTFCGGNGKCGLWRETSVGGDVFSLRESRSAQQKGQPVSVFDLIIQCLVVSILSDCTIVCFIVADL